MKNPKCKVRIDQYLSLIRPTVHLKDFLGDGTDGEVWSTDRDTAVKAFEREIGYCNERDSYQRLADFGITEKLGYFWVAKMVGFNDELMIVEMDMMHRAPYVIDFAKVTLNRPPEFPESTTEYYENDCAERFEGNWPMVQSLIADLESFQIYYLDPSPSNIVFPPRPPR